MARIAKSLATLRTQVNAALPKRSKSSDGWLGDQAHAARKSDHNPNSAGVVQAFDITHDPAGGFDSYAFAEHMRLQRDSRIKFVISNGRIFSSTEKPWQWRKYSGSNRHDRHVHISVLDDPKKYDDPREWAIDIAPKAPPKAPPPVDEPAPIPEAEPVPPAVLPSPPPLSAPAVPVPWYKRLGTWFSGIATSLFGGGLYLGGVQINAETILALCLLLIVAGIGFLVWWFFIRGKA